MGNRQQRIGGIYRIILTFLLDVVYICFVVFLFIGLLKIDVLKCFEEQLTVPMLCSFSKQYVIVNID